MSAVYRVTQRLRGSGEPFKLTNEKHVFGVQHRAEAEAAFLRQIDKAMVRNFAPDYPGKDIRVEVAEPEWREAA